MITLRAPLAEDINPLTEAVNLPGVQRGTLRMPYSGKDLLEARLLKPSPGVNNIVCCWEARAVGLGALILKLGRQRHSGDIYLFVHDDYWGKGLGRALLDALLDLSDNWYGLVRVGLEVAPTNVRAIQLYEAAGFEREGIKRADVICEGQLQDSVLMGRVKAFPVPPNNGSTT